MTCIKLPIQVFVAYSIMPYHPLTHSFSVYTNICLGYNHINYKSCVRGDVMINRLLDISMVKNKPLVIIYQSSRGITQRTIQVRSIKGDIIKALCFTKGEIRTFKIENILSAQLDFKRGIHDIKDGGYATEIPVNPTEIQYPNKNIKTH